MLVGFNGIRSTRPDGRKGVQCCVFQFEKFDKSGFIYKGEY